MSKRFAAGAPRRCPVAFMRKHLFEKRRRRPCKWAACSWPVQDQRLHPGGDGDGKTKFRLSQKDDENRPLSVSRAHAGENDGQKDEGSTVVC